MLILNLSVLSALIRLLSHKENAKVSLVNPLNVLNRKRLMNLSLSSESRLPIHILLLQPALNLIYYNFKMYNMKKVFTSFALVIGAL